MPVVAAIVAALVLALAVADPAVAASRYTVVPHDTLFSIARRFHVPLPLLEHVNGILDPSRIRVGQVLMIPDVPGAQKSAARAAAKTAGPSRQSQPAQHLSARPSHPSGRTQRAANAPGVAYVVRPGDTLYRIAVAHGTTVAAVQAANRLTSQVIIVGQVLRLPGAAAPAASAAPRTAAVPSMPAGHPAAAPLSAHPGPVQPAQPQPASAQPAPADRKPSPSGTGQAGAIQSAASSHESGRPVEVPVSSEVGVPTSTPTGAGTAGEPAARAVEPSRTALLSHVRASALGYVGVPYRWSGTTPAGVDCSGLVYLVYSPYVANLPRTSYDQWRTGVAIERADLAVGDLVFFDTDGTGASHVGIYVGDGQFVHSATTAQRVIVDRLDAPYYATRYLGARRIL